MDRLPQDLMIKISDLLSTSERARLAVLSKEWHDLITNNWTSIRLLPSKDAEDDEYASGAEVASHRQEQLAWLDRLAIHDQSPNALRSLYIHPLQTGTSTRCLLNDLHFYYFSRLQKFELEPSYMGSMKNCCCAWDSAFIAPEDMHALSSLTCLEVLRLIVDGGHCGYDEVPDEVDEARNIDHRSRKFSLDALAILPKLRELQISMVGKTGWARKRNLTMSARLHSSGFPSLKWLCFQWPRSWDLQSMAQVVSRLEGLQVIMEKPTAQMVDAPKLTYLGFLTNSYVNSFPLPFRKLPELQTLICATASIAHRLPDMSYNLVSLCLCHHPAEITPDIVRSWSTLTRLTQLTVGFMKIDEVSILQPFTGLSRLKSLFIENFEPELHFHRIVGSEDRGFPDLTKLVLKPRALMVGAVCDVDNMARSLPALREFSGRFNILQGELSSSTLHVLKIRYYSLLHTWPFSALIGGVPHLKTLSLIAITDLHKEKEMLTDILARLPRLEELCLVTRVKSHHPVAEDNGNTIDTFLQALSAATELTALKVVIHNSDLTLSLVSFPKLKSLAVACRTINFDCFSLPCMGTPYIDLHFMEASTAAIDSFRACQNVELKAASGPGWNYFNVSRKGQLRERPKDKYTFVDGINLIFACRSKSLMCQQELLEEFCYYRQGTSLLH